MMPNTAGPDSTRRQIVAYSVLLAPLGLAPVFLGFGGMIYGVVGLFGGLAMVALSLQVLRRREGEAANKAAMSLFGFSILYLFLLFSAAGGAGSRAVPAGPRLEPLPFSVDAAMSAVPQQLTPEEIQRRRKRSVAIAMVLAALVLIFYVLTIAKLGPQVLNRPL